MKNTLLVKTLRNFSEEEFNKFENYLNHSADKSKNLKLLLKTLKKYYPDFNHDSFTKEIVYRSVFGKSRIYNDQLMRNLICNLNRHCKHYLLRKSLTMDNRITEAIELIIKNITQSKNFYK